MGILVCHGTTVQGQPPPQRIYIGNIESTYVNIKAKNRILLPSPLKTCNLGLNLIGRCWLPRRLSYSCLIPCGELLSLLVGWGLVHSKRRLLLAIVRVA